MNKCIESIMKYGCKYSDIITKTKTFNSFECSICYGIIEGKNSSVLRVRLYNINTLNEVYFEGNVYDTSYCEKISFEEVIEDAKNYLSYQLNKLNEL